MRGEIDLIFKLDSRYVFVEVKTRTSPTQTLPEDAVTPSKIASIQRTLQSYLLKKKQPEAWSRIDVVAVELYTDPITIRHLPDITNV